jgi:hypothetical protein
MFERIDLIECSLHSAASANLLVFSFFSNIIRSCFEEARLDAMAWSQSSLNSIIIKDVFGRDGEVLIYGPVVHLESSCASLYKAILMSEDPQKWDLEFVAALTEGKPVLQATVLQIRRLKTRHRPNLWRWRNSLAAAPKLSLL